MPIGRVKIQRDLSIIFIFLALGNAQAVSLREFILQAPVVYRWMVTRLWHHCHMGFWDTRKERNERHLFVSRRLDLAPPLGLGCRVGIIF